MADTKTDKIASYTCVVDDVWLLSTSRGSTQLQQLHVMNVTTAFLSLLFLSSVFIGSWQTDFKKVHTVCHCFYEWSCLSAIISSSADKLITNNFFLLNTAVYRMHSHEVLYLSVAM